MNYLHIACLASIVVSTLLALLQIVFGVFKAEDAESVLGMKSLVNIMSWLSLLFIILDYLIGDYQNVQSALNGLSSHLLILGSVSLCILFIAVLSLAFLLVFKKTKKPSINAVSSIFKNNIIIVIVCVLLRWLVYA